MKPEDSSRRAFLRNSAFALGAFALPNRFAFAASPPQYNRLEWNDFINTSHYSSLLNAVSTMKANTNASDAGSWAYWSNAHYNYCPHGISYFCAWHRGYLYYFEKQLRTVSGDNGLILPYWDQYSYSTIPSQFTDTSSPLYVNRVNTDIYAALTMAPFAPTVTDFPRGTNTSIEFEPTYEGQPHNPIHNIIGNVMATMQSPTDPIFWLHHANLDRLWVAWVAAGGGRKMPPKSSSYWSGGFTYSSALTMQRKYTYDTTTNLNYTYENTKMPTGLPATAMRKPHIIRVQASGSIGTPMSPSIVNFQPSGAHSTSATTYSLGGVLNVGLDERSISAHIPISLENRTAIETIAAGNTASVPGSTSQYRSVLIVLDDLQMTEAGRNGGFFYKIYLNLPASGDTATAPEQYQIGTLGPFEIAGASHHSATPMLRYVITRTLAGFSAAQLAGLTVSFIRVSGRNSPQGPAIGIGEARVELSTEDLQS
jgi:tyrosinase